MNFTHEILLVDKFCSWLEEREIEYKREMRAWGTSYTDIVIREDNHLIGIEAKLKSFENVMYQAAGNQVFFYYNYILYPRLPSREAIETLKKYRIGIYIWDKSTQTFKKIIPAKKSKWVRITHYNRIKERWNKNLYAIRSYNKSELPENYPEENLEKEKLGSKIWSKVELESRPEHKPKKVFKDITHFMEVK